MGKKVDTELHVGAVQPLGKKVDTELHVGAVQPLGKKVDTDLHVGAASTAVASSCPVSFVRSSAYRLPGPNPVDILTL